MSSFELPEELRPGADLSIFMPKRDSRSSDNTSTWLNTRYAAYSTKRSTAEILEKLHEEKKRRMDELYEKVICRPIIDCMRTPVEDWLCPESRERYLKKKAADEMAKLTLNEKSVDLPQESQVHEKSLSGWLNQNVSNMEEMKPEPEVSGSSRLEGWLFRPEASPSSLAMDMEEMDLNKDKDQGKGLVKTWLHENHFSKDDNDKSKGDVGEDADLTQWLVISTSNSAAREKNASLCSESSILVLDDEDMQEAECQTQTSGSWKFW